MENEVVNILGKEKIDQICKEIGLDEEGKKKTLEIIEKWEKIVKERGLGEIDAKTKVALDTLGDDPNRGSIIRALIRINAEFMTKRFAKGG